jgi:glycosyltransferase involved in cell wall biosynthesis
VTDDQARGQGRAAVTGRVANAQEWRPLRTLAVLHLGDVGGPPKTLHAQLGALAERGELEVVVPARGAAAALYEPFAETTVLPYEALTYPKSLLEALESMRAFGRQVRTFRAHLRRRRPDLVVVATAVLPAAVLAARLERVPALVSVGEILEPQVADGPLRRAASAGLARTTWMLADAIVSCSHTVASQFPRSGPTLVATIYPGIAEPAGPLDRDQARRRFGVPPDALCLAVVGSLSAGRGQDRAIHALAHLRTTVPNAWCLIAGDPHPREVDRAYSRGLEQLAAELGVADAVVFSGFVEEVDDVYAAADVVVNPARIAEGFGRVAMEALLAGRPVVLTRGGAVGELLREDEDALVVDGDVPAALAEAVLRLWRDDAFAARLVASGAERVRRRYGEERSVAEFLELVDLVLSRAA